MRWDHMAGREGECTMIYRDLCYKRIGEQNLLLDLYLPDPGVPGPYPLFVYIHGGGWKEGDKTLKPATWGRIFRALNGEGFAAASINYRLLIGSEAANFTAPVVDCKDALRWLSRNSGRYGLDPGRFVVGGSSAGGHLALMSALTGNREFPGDRNLADAEFRIRAAVSWYGVTDLTGFAAQAELPDWTEERLRQAFRKISPVAYLNPEAPPMLLIHGQSDRIVPEDQSRRFFEQGVRLGLPFQYLPVAHADHSFRQSGERPIRPSLETILDETVRFVLEYGRDVPDENRPVTGCKGCSFFIGKKEKMRRDRI